MRTLGSLALATLLVTVSSTALAQSAGAPVRVVFRGRFDPALAALLTSELAANGREAYVTLGDDGDEGRADGPVLEIHLDQGAPHAVARPSPGVWNAAAISEDDPEAAALGAVSLLLEPPAPPPSRVVVIPALGPRLGAPGLARGPREPRETIEVPSPRRSVIVELDATTGIIANGASAALGVFVHRAWLLTIQGRALNVWTVDRWTGAACATIAYVGREANVDLEVGLEGGVLVEGLGANGASTGVLLGTFGGAAIGIDPAFALLARFGVYAGYLRGGFMPGLLVSLGARISP